jgi:hypothetical protein
MKFETGKSKLAKAPAAQPRQVSIVELSYDGNEGLFSRDLRFAVCRFPPFGKLRASFSRE